MFIPLIKRLGSSLNNPTYVTTRAIQSTNSSSNSSISTAHQLAGQWSNPSDVLSVLLIIGGDIVQKALAQESGGYFTPVCFSFGWVAYSLSAVVSIIGDGRLLPEPDHPVKVFNLKNGYVRENKSWIIGRVLRDNIMRLNKRQPLGGNGIRISVYDAQEKSTLPPRGNSRRFRLYSVIVILLQHCIAAIPLGLYREWGILLVTAAGTLLALTAGALPQWRIEKLPGPANSRKNFALTAGNGSRDIMVIRGNGNCIDLEELSAIQMPRSSRAWESHPLLSRQILENGKPKTHGNGAPYRKTGHYRGIPIGFWITMGVVVLQFVLWIALLIAVAGLRSHVWFLLGVGGLGMLQNVIVAASSREPEKRNLDLRLVEVIVTRKVMDGLMDLDVGFDGFGDALLKEFFPGKLHSKEIEWWSGEKDPYDYERQKESVRRGRPRRFLPTYARISPSNQIVEKEPKEPSKPPNHLLNKMAKSKERQKEKPYSSNDAASQEDVIQAS